jgi:hypothetical protein
MEGIEIPDVLLNKMPTEGGNPVKTDDAATTKAAQDAAAKKAADDAAKAKAEADKKAKDDEANKGGNPNDEGDEEDELSDEEINTKLEEISAKKEEELTDEDKEFLEKYNNQDDEITAVKKELEGTFGVKLEGEYENGVGGLKAAIKDALPQLVKKTFIESLAEVPYMKDFYNHVAIEGKSVDTFLLKNTTPDFAKIKVEEVTSTMDDNAKTTALNLQKNLIYQELIAKGMEESDVTEFIKLQEDTGKLFERAKTAKDTLVKMYEKEKEVILKQEEAKLAKQEEERKQTIEKVKEIIQSNNFDGLQIPTEDIAMFQEALLKPIDDRGNTLLDYKRSKLNLEKNLFLDYLVLKDFKVKGLTQKKVESTFNFGKAADDNNKRGGSRVRSTSSKKDANGSPTKINLTEFFQGINQQ